MTNYNYVYYQHECLSIVFKISRTYEYFFFFDFYILQRLRTKYDY